MANVGYIRIKSSDQDNFVQLQSVSLDKVFEEQANSTVKNRPVFLECINYLSEGDTLHVQSIDIIARNIIELFNTVQVLNLKGVAIHSHSEKLTFGISNDNSSATNDGQLHMLKSLAQLERNVMRERQQDGIERAKMAGRYLGRPIIITEELKEAIWQQIDKHGIAPATVAKEFDLSVSSVYKIRRNKKEFILATEKAREEELNAAMVAVFEQLANDPSKGVEISLELAEFIGLLDEFDPDICADDHLLTINEHGEVIYEGE